MDETADPRERLVRDALDAYKEEYTELSETWRNLDAKAQGTIAICGIFLAGMLAFVRTLSATATTCEQWLLTITAALLGLSIFFALLVLRVQTVQSPPIGESLDTIISELLAAEDGMTPERLLNYSHDQTRMWSTTNRDVGRVNDNKAGNLIKAQYILVGAIGCVVAFTLMKIWG